MQGEDPDSQFLTSGKNTIDFFLGYILMLCAVRSFLNVCRGTNRGWKRTHILWNCCEPSCGC